MRYPSSREPISLLIKPAGSRCNLDCLYCYDKRRDLADGGYLKVEDLRSLLSSCSGHPLNVTFHGGEPLVTPDHKFAEYFAELRNHDAPVTVGVVTNGTLLSKRRVESLLSLWPGLGFAISYDGPGTGSHYRVDFRARPTHTAVERGMRVLDDLDIQYSVMSVMTQATLGNEAELLESVASHKGAQSLRLLPCLDFAVSQSNAGARFRSPNTLEILRNQSGQASWAVSPEEYTSLVKTFARIWKNKRFFERLVLEPITSVIVSDAGGDSGYTDFSWRKQAYVLVLSSSGVVSTSDEFEGSSAELAAAEDISQPITEVIRSRPQDLWLQCERLLEACKGCSHRAVCRGGNLPDRLAYGADAEMQERYCSARKDLIDSVIEMSNNTDGVSTN